MMSSEVESMRTIMGVMPNGPTALPLKSILPHKDNGVGICVAELKSG